MLDDQSEISLNDAQQLAVSIDTGPALVVAGAGTGKTRVIIERIRRLIDDGVDPSSILALTFTEKAAGEMLDRLSAVSLGFSSQLEVATFNGFGNELLKQYGPEWGLADIKLLGETGQLVFLREHFDELGLDYFAPVSNPDGQLKELSGYISKLKQQLVEPEKYQEFVDKLPSSDEAEKLEKSKHHELANLYKVYLSLCRQFGFIDYDDQLYLAILLLVARPNVLAKMQAKYRYILVDEFQDTNAMQSALIDLLARKSQNIMVVGDDDQSIYGWRGATLANILEFTRRYPGTKEVTLIENYRSTQPILDCAYNLIQHNNPDRLEVINNLNKRLQAQTDGGDLPIVKHFHNMDAELNWIAEDISSRLKSGQPGNSIAILARRTNSLVKVHQILELNNIPHVVAGQTNDIYQQTAVKQLIEVLKAVADPLDDLALFHSLIGPVFGMSPGVLAELSNEARITFAPLAQIIRNSDQIEIKQAVSTISDWRNTSPEQSVGSLAYAIISETGWKQSLYEQAQVEQSVALQLQALSQYFKTLQEFERFSGVPSVQNYLLNLPVLRAGGSDFVDVSMDISDSEINVLSVHRAKGLEWDTVYIVDCVEGSFPLAYRGQSLALPEELRKDNTKADDHIAEERRLMYVATTRARRILILTYSDFTGGPAKRRPSRFLAELSGVHTDHNDNDVEQTNLELFSPKNTNPGPLPIPSSMKQADCVVLSVSQIVTWLDCPQEFYYRYILGVPQPHDPRQEYGTAIHAAIEKIHEGRRQGTPPTLASIWQSVKDSLPKSGYISEGSRDRDHLSARKSVGQIYERFISETLPIETEKPFNVEIPEAKLRFRGRLDAVYDTEGGIEIRDYKTSTKVRTAEQAKSRTTSSKQLALYALAWQLEHGELPAKLTLDFVETGQHYSVKKQARSLESLAAKLKQMVDDLNSSHYPLGKKHDYCSHPH